MRETLTLRPATEDDAEFLRALRNQAAVVAASRNSEAVEEATHREWLAASLESPTRRLFVVCANGVAIGQARLDAAGDGEWVSIAILQQERGKGHGTAVVSALQRFAHKDLLAEVRTTNSSSLGLFQRAGFEKFGLDGDFTLLRWANPIEPCPKASGPAVSVGEHAD